MRYDRIMYKVDHGLVASAACLIGNVPLRELQCGDTLSDAEAGLFPSDHFGVLAEFSLRTQL
jgi:hypothetical protein